MVFISLKRFSRFSWKGFSAAETWLPCTLIPSSKISTYVSWKSKYNYSIKYNSILSKILTSSFHFNFHVVNAYFRSILKVIKQFNPCLTLSLLHFNAPFPLKFQASVLRLEHSRVSPAVHSLTKKLEDSGCKIVSFCPRPFGPGFVFENIDQGIASDLDKFFHLFDDQVF